LKKGAWAGAGGGLASTVWQYSVDVA
jgi:hypothetical protein